MDDETWLTADEAVEQGFADESISFEENEIDNVVDLARFKNVPRALVKPRAAAGSEPKAPAKPGEAQG